MAGPEPALTFRVLEGSDVGVDTAPGQVGVGRIAAAFEGAGEVVDEAALTDERARTIGVVLPLAVQIGVEQAVGRVSVLPPRGEHAIEEAFDPGAIGVSHAPPLLPAQESRARREATPGATMATASDS